MEEQQEQETFDFKEFDEGGAAQLRSGKPLEGKEVCWHL